jgi:hypothetical protein
VEYTVEAFLQGLSECYKEIEEMKSEKSEIIEERNLTKMKRAKKIEKRLKNKKRNKNYDFHYK